jgi:hypothetical protein
LAEPARKVSLSTILARSLNRVTEVYCRHKCPAGQQYFGEPSGSAPTFKHLLGIQGGPKLLSQALAQSVFADREPGVGIQLCAPESIPLEAEVVCVGSRLNETRNPSYDLKGVIMRTDQLLRPITKFTTMDRA